MTQTIKNVYYNIQEKFEPNINFFLMFRLDRYFFIDVAQSDTRIYVWIYVWNIKQQLRELT